MTVSRTAVLTYSLFPSYAIFVSRGLEMRGFLNFTVIFASIIVKYQINCFLLKVLEPHSI